MSAAPFANVVATIGTAERLPELLLAIAALSAVILASRVPAALAAAKARTRPGR
jgi:hypothetical protein